MKEWSIIEALNWTTNYFKEKGIKSSRLEAEVLLSEVLGYSRLKIYLSYDQPLSKNELASYHQLVKRRSFYEPIAYIVGRKEFYGYDFKVTPKVLIPRPETELLVERIIEKLNSLDEKKCYQIVDIGTGSGSIAVTLAKNLNSYIYAIDISEEILNIASENAQNLKVKEKICFLKGNLLDPLKELNLKEEIEVIVSNPPYIPSHEINNLSSEVKDYEPLDSLDGGKDGIDYHLFLIKESLTYLKKGGYLYLELGINQAEILKKICSQYKDWHNLKIIKDYAKIDRILEVQKR
ncbi:peptide chain release factor N(5)-glutamine methyltransferase [bacterium]|nr:peptide chain release factor N(5)-glutamine methyltransferase [bacterium]MBU1153821.1 peptide chain release factor N(5)-glutamine methyltransferase [bacterium]MBU1782262.1 peptide chain release factor N(5)-glutamine methyltransferase [bacterium]